MTPGFFWEKLWCETVNCAIEVDWFSQTLVQQQQQQSDDVCPAVSEPSHRVVTQFQDCNNWG
jgi:hypothetical protein